MVFFMVVPEKKTKPSLTASTLKKDTKWRDSGVALYLATEKSGGRR
jgi:hypothetical protein